MKKILPAVLAALGILLAVIGYGYKNRYAASIGIIGGADGPTAIFVAGKLGIPFYAGIALALAAAVIAVMLIVRGRKGK